MTHKAELVHLVEGAELSLEVDPSSTHLGVVFHQWSARGKRPLGFFLVKLDRAQQNYSAFDRELLACYLSIRHFKWLLEGCVFHVLTETPHFCTAEDLRLLVWQAAASPLLHSRVHC